MKSITRNVPNLVTLLESGAKTLTLEKIAMRLGCSKSAALDAIRQAKKNGCNVYRIGKGAFATYEILPGITRRARREKPYYMTAAREVG